MPLSFAVVRVAKSDTLNGIVVIAGSVSAEETARALIAFCIEFDCDAYKEGGAEGRGERGRGGGVGGGGKGED